MVAPPEALPSTLPTDRLRENGKATRELRDELRQIAGVRNVGSIVLCWAQALGTIAFALYLHHPVAWVVSFVFMGPAFARFAILGHEAAHKLLFRNKRANDFVGRWIGSYPVFVPMDLYRRSHFAHHRDEFGPEEPDMNLYVGYPITRASMKRKLWRDLRGSSGWKNLKGLLRGMRKDTPFGVARRIGYSQVVLFVALSAWGVAVTGWVGLLTYPVLWLGPWMTMWRVINRLRAIAEHGGMTQSDDRRQTTHHVEQNLLAKF